MAFCALNTGPDTHLLDHIAPLASIVGMPLIVTEEENYALARKYYPEVSTRHWPDLDLRLGELAAEFDVLFECKYWKPELKELFRLCFGKEMKLVFCPHGQSDKGYKAPLLAPYALQDEVLLYGDLMREMLTELKVSVRSSVVVGNYRLEYFRRHQDRLRAVVEKEVFSSLRSGSKTLLYAPTWRDADQSTTFFDVVEKLVDDVPPHWNLLVKLHPLLAQRDPVLFHRLSVLETRLPNVLFIDRFPLVYPILERIDAYLGDFSSVGYDVLAFQKPMFFLEQPGAQQGRLQECGKKVSARDKVFTVIEQNFEKMKLFQPKQKALYERAFSEGFKELVLNGQFQEQ